MSVQISIEMFPELTQPGQHIVNVEYKYICVPSGIQETFVTQKILNVYGKEKICIIYTYSVPRSIIIEESMQEPT